MISSSTKNPTLNGTSEKHSKNRNYSKNYFCYVKELSFLKNLIVTVFVLCVLIPGCLCFGVYKCFNRVSTCIQLLQRVAYVLYVVITEKHQKTRKTAPRKGPYRPLFNSILGNTAGQISGPFWETGRNQMVFLTSGKIDVFACIEHVCIMHNMLNSIQQCIT